MILYLYTIDSWLVFELNSGSREGDQAKVNTLGPYARAFGKVTSFAAEYRTDIPEMKKLLEETGTILYRGTGLTKKEVQDYRAKIGKIERNEYGRFTSGHTTLTGYISTSMKRSEAQKFAWANDKTGNEATIFEIMWKKNF